MHYRPQELVQWKPRQDFLAPAGEVDPEAVRLYLTQYARVNAGETYPDDTDGTALG